jgi:hypothetical protein
VGKNVKQQLALSLEGVELVTPAIFEQLLKQTNSTPGYLKRLLRNQPIPLHPLIEGIRQADLDNLVRTLTNLSQIYESEPAPARAAVLESKTHTQILIARNPQDPWRKQVLLHLNTWLENPQIYPLWVALQKRNAASPEGFGGAS